jgi:hypothetical protein
MLRLTMFVALAALLPARCLGQANPDSVKHRNDCRLATQVLTTGHPAAKYQWALDKSWTCPEAAPAIAQRLESHATSRDTAALNALTAPTMYLRDGRIFAVALRIAGSKAASPEARVFAVRTLIYALRPDGQITYAALITPDAFCYGGGPSFHQKFTQGSPLPSDYVQQVNAVGQRLMRDSSEPAVIRRVGRCAAMARELILPANRHRISG